MAKMNIENVVASTSLGQELDLNKIEESLDGAEYNPQQFVLPPLPYWRAIVMTIFFFKAYYLQYKLIPSNKIILLNP